MSETESGHTRLYDAAVCGRIEEVGLLPAAKERIYAELSCIGRRRRDDASSGALGRTAPGPGAIAKIDRDRALDILDVVSQNIHETYYDPKMNGLDWNAVVQKARDKIVESNSLNDAFIQIAIAVSTLNDSHTRFLPPRRPFHLDFGFTYQMFGTRCLVTHVRSGSDAEMKRPEAGRRNPGH